MIDTAGIRNTDDTVEKIGIEKAYDVIEDSDLIIYIVDSSSGLSKDDMDIISRIQDKKAIILLNKTDLDGVVTKENIISLIDKPVIIFSAKTGDGLSEFHDKIYEMFVNGLISSSDEVSITSERQYNCLVKTLSSLRNVISAIEDGMTEDIYTVDLMDAYKSLGLIIGEEIEDDLADKIFKDFCMGK